MKKYSLPLILLCGSVVAARAQTTAFNYQGRLNDGNDPASGLFDLQFAVFDSPAGGSQVGGSITNLATSVDSGLFSSTLNFGAEVFTGPPRWLALSVRTNGNGTFTPLNPRQSLLPVPYAMFAPTAGAVANSSVTAAGIANGQAVKSLNGLRDAVSLVAGPNVTITPGGGGAAGTIMIAAAGASGGTFSLNGTNAFYNGGRVGIGTNAPQAKLHVSGGDLLAGAPGAEWMFHTRSHAGGDFLHITDLDNGVPQFQRGLILHQTGRVGIGFTNPDRPLAIEGEGVADEWIGFKAGGITRFHLNSRFNGWNLAETGVADGRLFVAPGGNVGVGTEGPVAGLHVKKEAIPPGGTLALEGVTHTYMTFFPDGVAAGRKGFFGFSGAASQEISLINEIPGGDVVIGSLGNPIVINDDGNVSVASLTIRGGADLAEPFPMKETELEKGSVVVIDDEHPGRLKLSARAYDTRVAGIVSGANGVNPGIALKQEGVLDQGQNVALTGRVYVKADASFGSIKPGDLLTTSDTPGHAMKAGDSTKSQGAILGKAMTALADGTGFVLVLVTLQ